MFTDKEKDYRLSLAEELYLQIVKEGDLMPSQREILAEKLLLRKNSLKRMGKIKKPVESGEIKYNY